MSGNDKPERKSFTFPESYYKIGKMLAEMKGEAFAYEYYKAIIEYKLNRKQR